MTVKTVALADLNLCPCCHGELDLHQPDVSDPDRLLGICVSCGVWSLIQLSHSRSSGAQILELPSSTALGRTPVSASRAPLPGPNLAPLMTIADVATT